MTDGDSFILEQKKGTTQTRVRGKNQEPKKRGGFGGLRREEKGNQCAHHTKEGGKKV